MNSFDKANKTREDRNIFKKLGIDVKSLYL